MVEEDWEEGKFIGYIRCNEDGNMDTGLSFFCFFLLSRSLLFVAARLDS